MYSHHFVDCMFVFIAFLNISGADTGFQKRGVVIINNKTSGGGGGGGGGGGFCCVQLQGRKKK